MREAILSNIPWLPDFSTEAQKHLMWTFTSEALSRIKIRSEAASDLNLPNTPVRAIKSIFV